MTIKIDELNAAIDTLARLDAAELNQVRRKIDAILAEHDKRNSLEAKRVSRMQAAVARDAPEIKLAAGELRRIGLDFDTAGDLSKLNAAMSARGLDFEKRVAIKNLLAQVGVID